MPDYRSGARSLELRTTKATDATITAVPATTKTVISSERIAQPRKTAITGLTNAYVATVKSATCRSSQLYAVNAAIDPMRTRKANDTQASAETSSRWRSAAS